MRKAALFVRWAVAAAALTTTAAVVPAQATGVGDLPPDLQSVRAATAKFHSVDVAAAAGYHGEGDCAASPAGVMGVHYVNFDELMDPAVEPTSPEVLLYVPGTDGSHKLAGVEYVVVDADQDLTTDDDRPYLFGQPFNGPMEGHGPGMPIHYDLHVWVWLDNPDGLFADWNPAASC